MNEQHQQRCAPPADAETQKDVLHAVWQALDTVKDPCNVLSGHDLSIVDMGLINYVQANDDHIEVGITFTEPGCLFGYRIIEAIEDLAPALLGVREIKVAPQPFPLWDVSRLSPKAQHVYAAKKAQFGLHRFEVREVCE